MSRIKKTYNYCLPFHFKYFDKIIFNIYSDGVYASKSPPESDMA